MGVFGDVVQPFLRDAIDRHLRLLIEDDLAVGVDFEIDRDSGLSAEHGTQLLNQHFDHLSTPVKAFCENLAARHPRKNFFDAVASLAGLKVLVIGDTIFDRYSTVRVQGLTSKNKILSGRFLGEETQCGGALAVFRHVKQFARQVKFVSLIGAEPWAQRQLRTHVAPGEDGVVRDAGFTVLDIPESHICCGSAGVWNVLNPAPAADLADRKARNVLATGAAWLVTANPGCLMQIAAGVHAAGGTIRTAHTAEVLDASIRGIEVPIDRD